MPHAGWYNDETDPTLARWFDGVAWTEHAVVKADWEAIGQPPPPPVELAAAGAPPRSGRVRMAVGSAAVAAVLVVAGVALAKDGDDPPAEDRPTAQDRDVAHGFGDDGDELDGLGDAVGDVPTDGSASGDDDGASGSSGSTGSTTKTSTSSKKTTQDGTVTRTERRSESHVIPGTSEAVGSRDQEDVGNDTNKNIDIDVEQRDPVTTTTVSPPPSTEDTTAPPPSVPVDPDGP